MTPAAADTRPSERDAYLTTANPEAFLRALHIQVALAPEPIDVRADLLLELVAALRSTNASYLRREVTGR